MHDLGLALSGGGSRAAAFHCGTLTALEDLRLINSIDVVSAVSGGSLLGAAWAVTIARGQSTRGFVNSMQEELTRGFVSRSLRPSLIAALTPGIPYSCTHLLAETFDRTLFQGFTLGQLPKRPALCLNATMLNNGQIAKFTREGFSAWGVTVPDAVPSHVVPWSNFSLAHAVAASAAFPIGLPPLTLRLRDFPPGTQFGNAFGGARTVYLTDGGVLENLGIQTLLKSQRYASWNLVVSDADMHSRPWRNRGLLGLAIGFVIWLLSGRVLERLMRVMNDKQNRWARQEVYDQLIRSWLTEEVRRGTTVPQKGMASYLDQEPQRRRRALLFVRVAQDWNSFFGSIPRWRLVELGERAGETEAAIPRDTDPSRIADYLEGVGCDLTAARHYYAQLGGDSAAQRMSEVSTNFTALPLETVQCLAAHAAWQVHAAHSIFMPFQGDRTTFT